MNPIFFLAPITLIAIVGMIARAVIKIAQMRASHEEPSFELASRVEALEGTVHGLQQELMETQERLDFAERMLSKGPQKS
jgi:hypothetical protein